MANEKTINRAVAYAKGCIAKGMKEEHALRKTARKFFVKKDAIQAAMQPLSATTEPDLTGQVLFFFSQEHI